MSKLYNILNSMITRLKKVETSSADWNASEGEAGHVKNRTHWVEKGAEIVPETTCTFSDGQATMPCNFVFNIGEEYTVTWNGVEYVCVGYDAGVVIAVGDGSSMFGGESTGEPFMLGATNGTLFVYAVSDDTSATFKITGSKVHKLDRKFLPDEDKVVAHLTPDDDTGEFACDMSFEEMLAAKQSGKQVELNCFGETFNYESHNVSYVDEVKSSMSFSALQYRNGFSLYGTMFTIYDDGSVEAKYAFLEMRDDSAPN